jgi:DNA-binding transcriptional LysR family regulator
VLVGALPRTHVLAARTHVPAAAIARKPFIMPPREALPFFHALVLRVCRDAGFVPSIRDEVDYPSMLLALVAAGLGVSIVPASVRSMHPPGVVLRSLTPRPQVALETALAWRRDERTPALAAFRDVARDVIGAPAGPGRRGRSG